MPVTALNLTPAILSQLNGVGIVGPFASNLSAALGVGVQNFVQSLAVQTQVAGTLGAGSGTGKWTLEPSSGASLIDTNLAAAAIPGYNKPKLAQAVATGIATVINTEAVVQTAVAGVAVGTGIGAVANADPSVAVSAIQSGLTSNAIVGSKADNLAAGLGQGIALWFATGVVNTAVAGSPVFPFNPTIGTGTGKIV
jgi:hypothetical protein